ncbi:hypothetical protein [Flaviaesturariibacter amylovorans]|uniref:Uncharacterized protein n=1 Tax=Flaviaesturariibacter amylovorans TaxID=1084520 RepID=A0ABP8GQZ0_9BACT
MQKEIPLLFSTSMVQATKDGRKTKTRRTRGLEEVNANPDNVEFVRFQEYPDGSLRAIFQQVIGDEYGSVRCPYGKPGDLLYVREEHYAYGKWVYDGVTKKTGKLRKKFVSSGEGAYDPYSDYYCFEKFVTGLGKRFELPVEPAGSMLEGWYKRNSLFMPKEAARIWLEVTDVRVERLQDISEADAEAEGIELVEHNCFRNYNAADPYQYLEDPTGSFRSLWQSINGPESWDANPWVWRISFKVLSTTGKPNI